MKRELDDDVAFMESDALMRCGFDVGDPPDSCKCTLPFRHNGLCQCMHHQSAGEGEWCPKTTVAPPQMATTICSGAGMRACTAVSRRANSLSKSSARLLTPNRPDRSPDVV
jgi:hypothetical protein